MGKGRRTKEARKPGLSSKVPVTADSGWEKFTKHPVLPIVTGAVIAFEVPGNIAVRIWAVFGCAVWCCIDLWFNLKRLGQYRASAFSLSCLLVGLLFMWPCYWLLGERDQDNQRQVKNELSAEATTFAGMSPMDTAFSVKNPSSIEIGQHHVLCYANLIVAHGHPMITNLNMGSLLFDKHLSGDGGTQTYDCLAGIHATREQVECLDVTVAFSYVLADQPSVAMTKFFRLVSTQLNGFVWTGQQADDPTEFCKPYLAEDAFKAFTYTIIPTSLISNAAGLLLVRPDKPLASQGPPPPPEPRLSLQPQPPHQASSKPQTPSVPTAPLKPPPPICTDPNHLCQSMTPKQLRAAGVELAERLDVWGKKERADLQSATNQDQFEKDRFAYYTKFYLPDADSLLPLLETDAVPLGVACALSAQNLKDAKAFAHHRYPDVTVSNREENLADYVRCVSDAIPTRPE